MIKNYGDFIEIQPINPYTVIGNESININLIDRKFSVIHLHDTRNDKDIMSGLKMVFGNGQIPQTKIIEIVLAPSEKSKSMKTTSHKIVYYDYQDLLADYEKIRNHILKKEPF